MALTLIMGTLGYTFCLERAVSGPLVGGPPPSVLDLTARRYRLDYGSPWKELKEKF